MYAAALVLTTCASFSFFADMWSREHAEPFDCIDGGRDSKLLVTTRIKGILDQGTEVELALLSVRESVELLSAVAQLDTNELSPCMIGIAQSCGRLPVSDLFCDTTHWG